MEKELANLENDMKNWGKILNEEGIWLFLATLGSWSIPIFWLQILAFLIVIFFFFLNANSRMQNRLSFPKQIKNLEEKIVNEFKDEKEQKALLYDLLQIKKQNDDIKNIKYILPYLVSLIFWIISFYCLLD